MYEVAWKDEAEAGLRKIDLNIVKKIKSRVEKHLAQNPYVGKPLKGNWKGFYSYRCFDQYRVIYEVQKTKLLIIVVKVGHRREVYC